MLRRTSFKQPAKSERKAWPFPSPISGGIAAQCGDGVAAQPKTEPKRNPHLLAMAGGKPCLFGIPYECVGGTETTVACHSNSSAHGKAGARKADDQYSAWGCFGCHHWLDTGSAGSDVKALAFMLAHLDQKRAWREIAAGPPSKDRAAAQWALDQLSAAGK